MTLAIALISFSAGLVGVVIGGVLSRRNEKKAFGERLLVEALNDLSTAVAHVTGPNAELAQDEYASALKRIALHAPPEVVSGFRVFQDQGTVETYEGRARLIAAFQIARRELGNGDAEDDDVSTLLFGTSPPSEVHNLSG